MSAFDLRKHVFRNRIELRIGRAAASLKFSKQVFTGTIRNSVGASRLAAYTACCR